MLKAQNRAQHILIVDDEPTLVFFLKQDLSQLQLACQVDNAAGGEEALSKLTLNKYDLLITDLKMTGINGFRFPRSRRQSQPTTSGWLLDQAVSDGQTARPGHQTSPGKKAYGQTITRSSQNSTHCNF
jgi:CheY-like chemotaxis protein